MAWKRQAPTLQFSRIDFFRRRGDEFFASLFNCIDRELRSESERAERWTRLNPLLQGLYAWLPFSRDLPNGGFAQYFYNHTDAHVPPLENLLKKSGNRPLASALAQATKVYRQHRAEFDVDNPFGEDGLFARMTDFAKIERAIASKFLRSETQLEKWARANIAKIAVGDAGDPINPKFTGEIETRHTNGKVFERATIKRGVINGAYVRYDDRGDVEDSLFYEAGKPSRDFWPSGQPKRKSMKRGQLTVHEWYYPLGALQKRYVAAKSGYAAEPVRMWHENGQLAEEIHTNGRYALGPWLRFFDDGSPQLEAEHGPQETLIIKNAWDDQRQQTVKNGRGTYYDDGLSINNHYDLFSEPLFTRSRQLQGGIPHGPSTSWFNGVLSSTETYAKGKLHGVRTCFYDNGRVRLKITYRDGNKIEEVEFPKFDDPRPAVLLETKSNDYLYGNWRLPKLDVYPVPTNLEKVHAKLTIPKFVTEALERHQSGKSKSKDDDINSFNDFVAHHVYVNERGTVDRVEPFMAGGRSGGVMLAYAPFLKDLKFKPGKLRGRNVSSRVLADVRFTFVEGKPTK